MNKRTSTTRSVQSLSMYSVNRSFVALMVLLRGLAKHRSVLMSFLTLGETKSVDNAAAVRWRNPNIYISALRVQV